MSRTTRRQRLQDKLESIPGVQAVYIQPPASIHMKYPCIVAEYSRHRKRHANNELYIEYDEFSVTLITKNPVPDDILSILDRMPYTSFDRKFEADNLHHFSYNMRIIEGD